MPRPKDRRCRVCGIPCTATRCKDCFHTKNNKIAGRYKLKEDNYLKTQLDINTKRVKISIVVFE